MEQAPEREDVEVWEMAIPGAVWVWAWDPRQRAYATVRVGGSGSRRIRIPHDDRVYNQELLIEENRHLDPFTNGTLVQIVGGKRVGITDEVLGELLDVHGEAFAEAVGELDNELSVRRLKSLVEERGSVAQLNTVNTIIETRWKVGGTQRTVREMIDAGELGGGEVLSG